MDDKTGGVRDAKLLSPWMAELKTMHDKIRSLESENERLRNALKKVAKDKRADA